MKSKINIIKKIILLQLIFSLTSCYTETINDFSTFTIQVPVYFYDKSNNRRTPSQGLDFTNLNTNAEFVKNKNKVNRAEVFQFSYWIDSLVIPESKKPFNPETDELIFERIRYLIMFAKPKSTAVEFSKDPNDFIPDLSIEPFVVGDFKNVKVSEYYKNPYHIVSIPDERAAEMSSTIKKQPYFFLVSEYSKYQNQPKDTIYFPWLEVRADIVIRLTVNL